MRAVTASGGARPCSEGHNAIGAFLIVIPSRFERLLVRFSPSATRKAVLPRDAESSQVRRQLLAFSRVSLFDGGVLGRERRAVLGLAAAHLVDSLPVHVFLHLIGRFVQLASELLLKLCFSVLLSSSRVVILVAARARHRKHNYARHEAGQRTLSRQHQSGDMRRTRAAHQRRKLTFVLHKSSVASTALAAR